MFYLHVYDDFSIKNLLKDAISLVSSTESLVVPPMIESTSGIFLSEFTADDVRFDVIFLVL